MQTQPLQLVTNNNAIDKGVYLGEYSREKRLRYKEDRHICVIGPTGVGKSTAIGVINFTLPRSIICLDPKGQLAAITARYRAERGAKNIILNPYGMHLDRYPHLESRGWNPLKQLDPASMTFAGKARALAQACVDHQTGGNSEYFNDQAENILTVFCMWEVLQNPQTPSLRNVLRSLVRADIEVRLKEMSESNIFAVSLIAQRILSRKTNKNAHSTSLEDVIDTLLKNMNWLIDDDAIDADMKSELGADKIDFAALHREITTIYVMLPVNQLEKKAKWLRMFLNLAYEELFEEEPPLALPRILMILDEIGNLGRLPQLLRALQIGRDYRLQVMTLWQDLQQIERTYDKEASSFFSSAGAFVAMGAKDWRTAEMISKMLGKRQVEMISYNDGHNAGQSGQGTHGGFNRGSNSGYSRATQVFDLLPPEDVMRLPKGVTINFIEPVAMPVSGKARGYWDVVGPGLFDPNPYYLG